MGEPAAGPLLALAARLGGVDPSAVEGLASLILDQPRGTPDPARSALNSNGDPLQLVISASTDGADIRLLADPAADAPEPRARRARARAATLRALEAVGAPAEPVLRMLAHLLPRDPYDGRDPGIGEQWLGVPVSARGLAVYVNAGWGAPADMSERLLRWVEAELPGNEGLHGLLRGAHGPDLVPAAAGLEVTPSGVRRVKVYVRLARPFPLRELGLPSLSGPLAAHFLRTVLDNRPLPGTGLLLAAGLRPGIPGVDDVKVDICGCDRCLPAYRASWPDILAALRARLGFDLNPGRVLPPGVRPAVIGLGLGGSPRLNLYLQAAA